MVVSPRIASCGPTTKKNGGRIVAQATALDEIIGKSNMPLVRILDAESKVMTMIEIAQVPSTFSPQNTLESGSALPPHLEASRVFGGY